MCWKQGDLFVQMLFFVCEAIQEFVDPLICSSPFSWTNVRTRNGQHSRRDFTSWILCQHHFSIFLEYFSIVYFEIIHRNYYVKFTFSQEYKDTMLFWPIYYIFYITSEVTNFWLYACLDVLWAKIVGPSRSSYFWKINFSCQCILLPPVGLNRRGWSQN
jgi:hypothetical protein